MTPTAPTDIMEQLGALECYYLDYNVASKEGILSAYNHIRERLGPVLPPGMVMLQTCLRNEIYIFDRSVVPYGFFECPELNEYVHIKGRRCLLRLIRLLCGLQSELTGEMEIYGQAGAAFNEAASRNVISNSQFRAILFALQVAQVLRKKHDFCLNENYSTVGADLINSQITGNSTIGLIGSGYMMSSFLKNFDSTQTERLIWINRSKDNAKKLAKELHIPKEVTLEYYDMQEGEEVLPDCDYIFAAVTNCGSLYSHLQLPKAKCIVDVSYPPLFTHEAAEKVYSLKNTYFEQLVKRPLSKESKRGIEAEIEHLVCEVWE